MRRGFSMIELIMTMIIMGILAGGAYISISKLYTKRAKAKAISELSLDSSRISEQIAALLSYRIPSSVIGYDMNDSSFESIYNLSKEYGVLEWISQDFENFKARKYSGFIDFDASDKNALMLDSPDTDIDAILTEDADVGLLFAGAFDEGILGDKDSFGWHGHNATKIFTLDSASSDTNITLSRKPDTIYERYFLADGAFAIARAADVNASCRGSIDTVDDSLLLYYNYKPWKGENFCDDANVTILSDEVSGFTVDFIDGNLQFNLTLARKIRKPGEDLSVKISKTKVVF